MDKVTIRNEQVVYLPRYFRTSEIKVYAISNDGESMRYCYRYGGCGQCDTSMPLEEAESAVEITREEFNGAVMDHVINCNLVGVDGF